MFVILLFCCKGIEIQGLPESFIDELNAEEVWDSVRQEIITSSLTTGKFTCHLYFKYVPAVKKIVYSVKLLVRTRNSAHCGMLFPLIFSYILQNKQFIKKAFSRLLIMKSTANNSMLRHLDVPNKYFFLSVLFMQKVLPMGTLRAISKQLHVLLSRPPSHRLKERG